MKLRYCKDIMFLGLALVLSVVVTTNYSAAFSSTSLKSFSSDIVSQAAIDAVGNEAAYIKMDEFGYYRATKFDFASMKETYLSSENSIALDTVLINDSYAVWFDARTAGRDVYFSNLKTGLETKITTTPNIRSYLSLSGNYTAYVEYGIRAGIYVADLSKAKPIPVKILTLPENNQFASYHMNTFDGLTYIAFVDPTTNAGDIKLYNCNTGNLSSVAQSEFFETNPVIQDGHVYYTRIDATQKIEVEPDCEGYNTPGSVNSFDISTQETAIVLPFDKEHMAGVIKNKSKSPVVIWVEKITGAPTEYKYHIVSDSGIDDIVVDMENERVRCSENCAFGNFVAFRVCNQISKEQTIKVYDISKKTMTTVDDSEGIKTNPVMDNNRIIFTKLDPNNKPFYRIFAQMI